MRALDRRQKPVEFDGLRQIFEDVPFGGGHDRFHGAAAGHQNDRATVVGFARRAQHVDPRTFIQIDVGDHDWKWLGVEPRHRFPRGRGRFHIEAFELKKIDESAAPRAVVFYDQQRVHVHTHLHLCGTGRVCVR